MKPMSLRRSLMLRLGALVLVFSGLSSVVVYRLALDFSNEAYDEWLLDSARSLSFLVEQKDGALFVDLPEATLQALVWDANDIVLFRIDSANLGFIVDAIDAREIEIHYVGTADQVADISTNQRDVATFVRHRDFLLGVADRD